jgi:hypothetical protein
MHIFGKILLGLVIVGGAASVAFTAQMITVRNSWTQKNDGLRKSNIENATTIASKEAEIAKLRNELKTVLLNWGTPITGFNVNQANAASVSLPIGMRDGIVGGQNRQPAGENPFLQAFRAAADGSEAYVWVGPFRVQSVTDTNSELVPTWTVRPQEADPWNAQNQRWRVWQRVPGGRITRFTDLQLELVAADQSLNAKNDYLTDQQRLLVDANTQNQKRLQELLGPAEAGERPDKLVGLEFTHGLLAAISSEEEDRNSLQADIDRLRRELKTAYATLQGTSDDNTQLIKELPVAVLKSPPQTFAGE